jgi:hypothetical protein
MKWGWPGKDGRAARVLVRGGRGAGDEGSGCRQPGRWSYGGCEPSVEHQGLHKDAWALRFLADVQTREEASGSKGGVGEEQRTAGDAVQELGGTSCARASRSSGGGVAGRGSGGAEAADPTAAPVAAAPAKGGPVARPCASGEGRGGRAGGRLDRWARIWAASDGGAGEVAAGRRRPPAGKSAPAPWAEPGKGDPAAARDVAAPREGRMSLPGAGAAAVGGGCCGRELPRGETLT